MFKVSLAGYYLYGKWLFTWLLQVMSFLCLVLYVPSFFPRYVLDEIWDLIEPVSERFPIHSYIHCNKKMYVEKSAPERERERGRDRLT